MPHESNTTGSAKMDKETGMYYYGARYYDPRISIFVSVDPLAEEFPNYGGYVYTMNNPINLVDPTGMAPEESDGWIIQTSKRDGNTLVTYDSSINNMEEAKEKGYRDVEGVLETGYFIGEDDVWRLEDNAMIYGEYSGIVKNVGFEGYRANDGTYFAENNQLKSLGSGLQNGGTALTYIGIGASITKVGAPVGVLMMTIGEGMNLVGTGIEFAYLYSEGHKKEAIVKLGISLLFVGSGNLGIKATQKAVGRETLDTGSETLIKSTNTVIENTIGKDTEEMLNKKRH